MYVARGAEAPGGLALPSEGPGRDPGLALLAAVLDAARVDAGAGAGAQAGALGTTEAGGGGGTPGDGAEGGGSSTRPGQDVLPPRLERLVARFGLRQILVAPAAGGAASAEHAELVAALGPPPPPATTAAGGPTPGAPEAPGSAADEALSAEASSAEASSAEASSAGHLAALIRRVRAVGEDPAAAEAAVTGLVSLLRGGPGSLSTFELVGLGLCDEVSPQRALSGCVLPPPLHLVGTFPLIF